MKPPLIAALCLCALTGCNLLLAGRPSSPGAPIAPLVMADRYLTGVHAVTYDPFDSMLSWRFEPEDGFLDNGVFEMNGTAFWHSHLSYKSDFAEGQGLAIRFKVLNANGNAEFIFASGDWKTDSFRQFGLYTSARPKADLFQGLLDLGGYPVMGNLVLRSDTWYGLLLAVGHGGHFLAVFWDPASDSQRAIYDLVGGDNWSGRKWTFLPKANQGETVSVDDFYKISFAAIK